MSNSVKSAPSQDDLLTVFYTPGSYQPQDTIGFIIKNVHMSLNKMIDQEMQKYDLTAMQWRPLLYLHFGKITTAAALAKETCMDTGATTRMLDRLQNKGLIMRKRCDQDRRVVHLALTKEGERTCAKLPADLCKVMNQHLKGFTQAEVDMLTGYLNRMLVNGQLPSQAEQTNELN